jgi:hypothetical protein
MKTLVTRGTGHVLRLVVNDLRARGMDVRVLLAGLDDSRSDVRILAESLLHRPCPRLTPT